MSLFMKKYETEEEKINARKESSKKYYDKIKEKEKTEEQKESRKNTLKKYYDKIKKEKNIKDRKKYNTLEEKKEGRRIALKKYKKYDKKSRTHEIIGCSYEEIKFYLESKFEPWMNWENYGKFNGELNYGWDIDHVIPLSTVTTEEDVIRLNHYTNLQPLCSYTNRYIKCDNINFYI